MCAIGVIVVVMLVPTSNFPSGLGFFMAAVFFFGGGDFFWTQEISPLLTPLAVPNQYENHQFMLLRKLQTSRSIE